MRTCVVDLATNLVVNVIERGQPQPANATEDSAPASGFAWYPHATASIGWHLVAGDLVPLQPPQEQPLKAALQTRIVGLEVAQLLPRTTREGILGGIIDRRLRGMGVVDTENATDAQIADAVAQLSDRNGLYFSIGFVKLKAFDDSIGALRTQMNALP